MKRTYVKPVVNASIEGELEGVFAYMDFQCIGDNGGNIGIEGSSLTQPNKPSKPGKPGNPWWFWWF